MTTTYKNLKELFLLEIINYDVFSDNTQNNFLEMVQITTENN